MKAKLATGVLHSVFVLVALEVSAGTEDFFGMVNPSVSLAAGPKEIQKPVESVVPVGPNKVEVQTSPEKPTEKAPKKFRVWIGPDLLYDAGGSSGHVGVANPSPDEYESPSRDQYKSCVRTHENLGLNSKSAEKACNNYHRVYQTENQDVKTCLADLKSYQGVQPYLAFACFHRPVSISLSQEDLKSCLIQTSSQSSSDFWYWEEIAYVYSIDEIYGTKKSKQIERFPKTRFENFFRDCAKPLASTQATRTSARLVGAVNFNSAMTFIKKGTWSDTYINVGGLSGLSFDSRGRLIAVSDEKRKAFLHKFEPVLPSQPDGPFSIKYLDSLEINMNFGADFDLEDLFLFPDGRAWVSTDISLKGNNFGGFGLSQENKKNSSFLFELDSEGRQAKSVSTPEDLIPQRGSVEVDCPFQGPSNWGARDEQPRLGADTSGRGPPSASDVRGAKPKQPVQGSSVFTEQKIQQIQNETPPNLRQPEPEAEMVGPPKPPEIMQRKKCMESRQIKGVRSNRAVEAFAVDMATNRYWVTTEQPLANEKVVKFFEMDMKSETLIRTIEYPMDSNGGNGLTSILYINGVFLTVERAHQYGDTEAKVNVFVAKINSLGTAFEKKILISNAQIKSKMAPGFYNVDNFEGIAVSKSPNADNALIYLVSDNNFSAEQRSVFLIYEVSNDLLR